MSATSVHVFVCTADVYVRSQLHVHTCRSTYMYLYIAKQFYCLTCGYLTTCALPFCRTNPISPYFASSWTNLEFICSTTNTGMLTCDQIEPRIVDGILCTEEFYPEAMSPFSNVTNRTSCVNYNQYYTECRAEGPNPFQQAISFDNIASAWIAIFQVR